MFVYKLLTINTETKEITQHHIAVNNFDLETIVQRFRKELPKYKDDMIFDCTLCGKAYDWTKE